MDLVADHHRDPFPRDWTTNHVTHHEDFGQCPLDPKRASIRLIKVLPDLSDNGLTGCGRPEHMRDLAYNDQVHISMSILQMGFSEKPEDDTRPRYTKCGLQRETFQSQQKSIQLLNSMREVRAAADPFWIDASEVKSDDK